MDKVKPQDEVLKSSSSSNSNQNQENRYNLRSQTQAQVEKDPEPPKQTTTHCRQPLVYVNQNLHKIKIENDYVPIKQEPNQSLVQNEHVDNDDDDNDDDLVSSLQNVSISPAPQLSSESSQNCKLILDQMEHESCSWFHFEAIELLSLLHSSKIPIKLPTAFILFNVQKDADARSKLMQVLQELEEKYSVIIMDGDFISIKTEQLESYILNRLLRPDLEPHGHEKIKNETILSSKIKKITCLIDEIKHMDHKDIIKNLILLSKDSSLEHLDIFGYFRYLLAMQLMEMDNCGFEQTCLFLFTGVRDRYQNDGKNYKRSRIAKDNIDILLKTEDEIQK